MAAKSQRFVWHPYYIDALAVRYWDSNTDGDYADTNEGTHYYCQDANFNVTAIVNSSGSVLERYNYTPYGEVTFLNPDFSAASSQYSSAIGNTHPYTGRERDPETGLQLNRHRYYASWLGRWTSRDPIGYRGGPNLYWYLGGMPTRFVDPSGTSWWDDIRDWLWPPEGPPDPPKPDPNPTKDAIVDGMKELIDCGADQCADLPGAAGDIANCTKFLSLLDKCKGSIEDIDDVRDDCQRFMNKPDFVGCYSCCFKTSDLFPELGGWGALGCRAFCASKFPP